MQGLRRGGLGILDLRRRQTRREHGKDSAGDLFWIDTWVAVHAVMDALQERTATAGCPARAGMPAFIIKTSE